MKIKKLRDLIYKKPPKTNKEWLNLLKKTELPIERDYVLQHCPYKTAPALKGAVTRQRRKKIANWIETRTYSLPGTCITTRLRDDLKSLGLIKEDSEGNPWGAAWGVVSNGSKTFTGGNGKRMSTTTWTVNLYIPKLRKAGYYSYHILYKSGGVYWSYPAAVKAAKEFEAETKVPFNGGARYGQRL